MKFRIHRVSFFSGKPKPCEGAFLIDGERGWFIEINTLEELIALSVREDESLVVDKDSIYIYDDYME
jgi:hypothetical protein